MHELQTWVAVPLAVACALHSAIAIASPPSERAVRLGSASDVFAVADLALGHGDPQAAETALRALFDDPALSIRSEARFRLAKLLASTGRSSDAAVLLRRILDEQPRSAPVRLELAALLHQLGEEDSALHELRALRTAALPPNIARFVDRMSASLQANKPFGLQIELGLAPDSNINRGARSDLLTTVFGDFNFDEDARPKSGTGAAIRGSAHTRFILNDTANLVAWGLLDANLYRDKAFDDGRTEISIGPEMRIASTRVSGEIGFGRQWYGMKAYQDSLKLAARVTRPVDSVSQLRLDGSARWSRNRLNKLQDGQGFSLTAQYDRALSQRLAVTASLGADRFRARDDAYSTKSWLAGLSVNRELGRMTLNAGAEIGRLRADERLLILPASRHDKLSQIYFGAIMRQLSVGGFAPFARLIIERNRSNVEYYDYKRTRTEWGISRAF
jgi:tetratricopeptide (TPR) repeat protein